MTKKTSIPFWYLIVSVHIHENVTHYSHKEFIYSKGQLHICMCAVHTTLTASRGHGTRPNCQQLHCWKTFVSQSWAEWLMVGLMIMFTLCVNSSLVSLLAISVHRVLGKLGPSPIWRQIGPHTFWQIGPRQIGNIPLGTTSRKKAAVLLDLVIWSCLCWKALVTRPSGQRNSTS